MGMEVGREKYGGSEEEGVGGWLGREGMGVEEVSRERDSGEVGG